MEENASVYRAYAVSHITGEGRAELLRARWSGFDQEGAGGGGSAQLNLCAETKSPLRKQI